MSKVRLNSEDIRICGLKSRDDYVDCIETFNKFNILKSKVSNDKLSIVKPPHWSPLKNDELWFLNYANKYIKTGHLTKETALILIKKFIEKRDEK